MYGVVIIRAACGSGRIPAKVSFPIEITALGVSETVTAPV
jgi:hypothetical protein